MTTQTLQETILERHMIIMTHRGFWGGNIIQNTRQAAQLAMKAGSDIIEIDVCRSKDGKYYLFHNGNEQTLLGVDKDFSELSSSEIDALPLYNSVGSPSGYRVEYLEDFLHWLPKGYVINIDRSWFYWDDVEFFNLLNRSGKVDQLIIKSPAKEECLSALNEINIPLSYVPIVYNQADVSRVKEYTDIQIVGVELIVDHLNEHELLNNQWLSQLTKNKWLIIANSEHLGERFRLFDQLNDSEAVLANEEKVWGKMQELGINVIQTDWPNFLDAYRQQIQT